MTLLPPLKINNMLPTVTVSPLNFQIGHNLFTEKGECGGGILKDILLVSTYSRGY